MITTRTTKFMLGHCKDRLVELLRYHSVRIGKKDEFTLASGAKSDWFCDVKQTALKAEGIVLLGQLILLTMIDQGLYEKAAFVAGVELGGCPLATAVSYASFMARELELSQQPTPLAGRCLPVMARGLDTLYVRKTVKDHGTKKKIEGGGRGESVEVVLLEDVTTTGGSALEAAGALREAGYIVSAIISVVDRDEGGARKIREYGHTFIPLTSRLRDFTP